MEYERIHKVQTGIISPTKLRMKLIGTHHSRRKDGSNSNSSRTSPSKLQDSEFDKNSLLAPENDDLVVSNGLLEVRPANLANEAAVEHSQGGQASELREFLEKVDVDTGHARPNQCPRGENNSLITVPAVRAVDDENLDYDSNASSSSFEFHKGERSALTPVARSVARPMPSKWNDAEKWIMNKQTVPANFNKKGAPPIHGHRLSATNVVKVAPESPNYDPRLSSGRVADTKRVDFCQAGTQMGYEKFSFVPSEARPYGGNGVVDSYPQTRDLKEVVCRDLSCSKSSAADTTGTPAVRSVSMRDMGTEMTPVTSQEPSRTTTPLGASPLRSPTSSIPSTPRRGLASSPVDKTKDEDLQRPGENCKRKLSEEELKLKTRKEIVALGLQLGKMNIAAWASKDDQEKSKQCSVTGDKLELQRLEFESRAAAWEEAEKSKHMARYKREEVKIQAWESQQKAKLEAEMQGIEAQVEQLRAQAQAKMMKKIAMARQRAEEKRASAESRKNRDAERTAAKAEYIRQTGRMPSSHYFTCCGWLS